MGFGIWFKMWWMSFFRLLTCGAKPRKSEGQRKKERERRLKAKYSSSAKYRLKKQHKRRRSSHNAANLRTIRAVFGFLATTLSIVFLPFGLFQWGYKNAQVKRKHTGSKATNIHSGKTSNSQKKANAATQGKTEATTASQGSKTASHRTPNTNHKKPNGERADESFARDESADNVNASVALYTCSQQAHNTEAKVYTAPTEPEMAELDENTPKSTPKNTKDQYIRKRMIIAGSAYCDKAVLDQLQVGSYIELVPEPDNAYDKDAVMLTFKGQKIGYIAKKDLVPFSVCLKLKRNIYGIITAIIDDEFPPKFEYETWFNSERTQS